MEGERSMGAGPETTGNEVEQLALFNEHQDDDVFEVERPPERRVEPHTLSAYDVALGGLHRLHRLGARPDRLHTSDHFGARGDRLEGRCLRNKWENN